MSLDELVVHEYGLVFRATDRGGVEVIPFGGGSDEVPPQDLDRLIAWLQAVRNGAATKAEAEVTNTSDKRRQENTG